MKKEECCAIKQVPHLGQKVGDDRQHQYVLLNATLQAEPKRNLAQSWTKIQTKLATRRGAGGETEAETLG